MHISTQLKSSKCVDASHFLISNSHMIYLFCVSDQVEIVCRSTVRCSFKRFTLLLFTLHAHNAQLFPSLPLFEIFHITAVCSDWDGVVRVRVSLLSKSFIFLTSFAGLRVTRGVWWRITRDWIWRWEKLDAWRTLFWQFLIRRYGVVSRHIG